MKENFDISKTRLNSSLSFILRLLRHQTKFGTIVTISEPLQLQNILFEAQDSVSKMSCNFFVVLLFVN